MSTTPNIDLALPSKGTQNWGAPTAPGNLNNNFTILDSIFGGAVNFPAIWPSVIVGLANLINSVLVNQNVNTGAGGAAGTRFALPYTLGGMIGLFYVGILQRPGIDYSVASDGSYITLTFDISSGDDLRPVYLKLN